MSDESIGGQRILQPKIKVYFFLRGLGGGKIPDRSINRSIRRGLIEIEEAVEKEAVRVYEVSIFEWYDAHQHKNETGIVTEHRAAFPFFGLLFLFRLGSNRTPAGLCRGIICVSGVPSLLTGQNTNTCFLYSYMMTVWQCRSSPTSAPSRRRSTTLLV